MASKRTQERFDDKPHPVSQIPIDWNIKICFFLSKNT